MATNDDNETPRKFAVILFQSSPFLALTIGLPFCVFKALFGSLAIQLGGECDATGLLVFGICVVIWASIDFLMNLSHIVLGFFSKTVNFEYCLLSQVGRLFRRQSLFLCVDTLVSFLIICFVLWSGWITKLTPFESKLWYLATTVNLVSLAIVAIITEYHVNSDCDDVISTKG